MGTDHGKRGKEGEVEERGWGEPREKRVLGPERRTGAEVRPLQGAPGRGYQDCDEERRMFDTAKKRYSPGAGPRLADRHGPGLPPPPCPGTTRRPPAPGALHSGPRPWLHVLRDLARDGLDVVRNRRDFVRPPRARHPRPDRLQKVDHLLRTDDGRHPALHRVPDTLR